MIDSPASIEREVLAATCSTTGALVTSNDAWQMVFGSGPDAWSRLSPDDRGLVHQYVSEAAAGQMVTHQIFPVEVPDRDEPLPVLLHFLPVHVPEEDGVTSIRAVLITGEVLAEPTSWTVSQTQRHRLETLGRMTMGIAHDFNNLLSGILGYTELLKTIPVERGHTESYDEHLSTIEKAALDGAALVRKIQQYIRREKQKLFEPLDLPSLIEDCIALTRPYWYNEPRRQGVEIQLTTDLKPVPPVLGSAAELREVFVNLILNAVQAMPRGGELVLRTFFREDRGVCACVSDTGTGMSDTVRDRIFEPLFTTKGERGTGMGLAVSYGIVQEHDGRIAVESTLGQGTSFTIILPPGEAAPAVSEEEEDADGTAARILLVDDERMVRTVLAKLLALRGHSVETAPSGSEALELTTRETFDVIFIDQAMPEMSGRELARHLRQRFADVPIVLLTGDTEVGEPGEDIDIILSKPFQIDEVEATIQRLLSGRRQPEAE